MGVFMGAGGCVWVVSVDIVPSTAGDSLMGDCRKCTLPRPDCMSTIVIVNIILNDILFLL